MKPALTPILSFFLLMTSVAVGDTQVPLLRLGTNVTSAFAADYAARIEGGSAEHIECILKRLQQPYQVTHMPWRRAHQEVRKQNLDGFFTAILRDDVDEYGELSAPLVLENWYWFWRADITEPNGWADTRVGAVIGSPQAIWLSREDYPEPVGASNLPQLVKMLLSGRIDAVLADKEHFERVATDLKIDTGDYQYRFYRYMPLGVYFSRVALSTRGDFLERFNRQIAHCAPDAFQVSEYEREKIKAQLMPLMLQWSQRESVVAAVAQQNMALRNTRLHQLLQFDQEWQVRFYDGYSEKARDVLGNDLSADLRELKRSTQSLVSEIIVVDERGFNVGISDMTSDYWQGDEDKYLQVFGRPSDTLLFDAVAFDESTRRFQVQLSIQIYKLGVPRAQGIMTIGVDIEKALSLSQ